MNTKGFTLVEVLIGLFIAVIASAYAAKTITSTNKVVAAGRDTFIATNLAHEGIDLTRAMRDNTWFSGVPTGEWLSKSGICETTDDNSFALDPDIVRDFIEDQDNTVLSENFSELYVQDDDEQWTHEVSDDKTPYSRVVHAQCAQVNGDPAFVTITSTVTWEGQSGEQKNISIKELLYNWWL